MRAEDNALSVPLSVLDLVPIAEGSSAGDAIEASMLAARLADELGYRRFWFAEHHNDPSVASSATALLISQAASVTERLRLGSGGVMLPNHAPLMVAEQFGTMAHIHGNRIDLGLGRAQGTDGKTSQMLRRSSAEPEAFVRSVEDFQGWFSQTGRDPNSSTLSAPSAGTEVPIWVLGSSPKGASVAGQLGLPFSLASHFAPDQIDEALQAYRESFNPDAQTAQIDKPYVMAAVNVMIADTDVEAEREYTTVVQMFINRIIGNHGKIQPPADPETLPRGGNSPMLRVKAVGSPKTAKAQLEAFVERTGADELMTVTYAYDPVVRYRSLQLLADTWF